ncbi:hypothetical protein D9M68_931160 [compost metagenome]
MAHCGGDQSIHIALLGHISNNGMNRRARIQLEYGIRQAISVDVRHNHPRPFSQQSLNCRATNSTRGPSHHSHFFCKLHV